MQHDVEHRHRASFYPMDARRGRAQNGLEPFLSHLARSCPSDRRPAYDRACDRGSAVALIAGVVALRRGERLASARAGVEGASSTIDGSSSHRRRFEQPQRARFGSPARSPTQDRSRDATRLRWTPAADRDAHRQGRDHPDPDDRPCAGGAGTWRVLSGSKAYARADRRRRATGGRRCISPRYPAQAMYTGVVRTPPPPPLLAQPGRFGGGTSQREEVILDVLEGGQTLGEPSAPRHHPVRRHADHDAGLHHALRARTRLRPDKSVLDRDAAGLLERHREGAIHVADDRRGNGDGVHQDRLSARPTRPMRCSADVTWSASLPPPAATPGTYCGFTNQGSSICLDVAPSGRDLTRVEVGVVVLCNGRTVEVEVRMVFTAISIGGNLGFSKCSSTLEGLISGAAMSPGCSIRTAARALMARSVSNFPFSTSRERATHAASAPHSGRRGGSNELTGLQRVEDLPLVHEGELSIDDPAVVAALYDPLRYRLFRLLETPRSVAELAAEVDMPANRL